MDERDRLVGQIRALLDKTVDRGCTEAEAASAAAMVEKLVLRHAIDLDNLGEPESTRVTSLLEPVKSPWGVDKRWLTFMAGVVARLCLCRAMNHVGPRGGVLFVGYPDEVRAASELFRFLREQAVARCQWEWRQRGGMLGHSKFATSFLMGYASRVAERLQESISPPAGLPGLVAVRDEEIDKYLEQNYDVKDDPLRDLEVDSWAYEAGRGHGSNVTLAPTRPLEN